MKFQIEQVALCPRDPERAIELLKALGMEDWVRDHVCASGEVFGAAGSNEADLAFNYQGLEKARELEVLHYTHGKRNWMDRYAPSVSHLGMHVSADELIAWREFFAVRDIAVAQEVVTESHTNEFLLYNGRRYNYVIFDTREILGVDLKFIVRIENSSYE